MRNERWILPEGIDEVLPGPAERLEGIRRQVLDRYRSWGYELVVPPLVEYLESLLTGTGGDLDLQTFKLTDQLTGRMMGIRADMTPQVARIDAHRLRRDVPTRLCYLGPVLYTRAAGFSGSRSPLQVGAELYGHAGVESDIEILRLMMQTLYVAGIKEVYLDLGHVGIFRGLARQAGLSAQQEAAMFDAQQRKAIPEIRELLGEYGLTPELTRMFLALAELNGEQCLARARQTLSQASAEVLAAIDYLDCIAVELSIWMPDVPVHFDLAELRGYRYKTGVVFAAFVPGQGQEVARGGRYDGIGAVFGRSRPAVGFSADIKTLLELGQSTGDGDGECIWAPWSSDERLNVRLEALRAEGKVVVYALPGQNGGAAEMGCSRRLVEQNGEWVLADV